MTCSLNIVYSDEAKEEIKAFLNSSKYYVDFSGRLTFSVATDTVNYVVKNLTGF